MPPALTADASYAEFARELTVDTAVRATLVIGSCAALWWPVDLLVAPDPRYGEAFAFLRTGLLALMAALYAGFRWSPPVRRHALLVAVLGYAATMGFLGYALGRLGGPELPWFADAFIGLVPTAVLPLALPWRVPAVALITASMLAGHFAPFPEHRASAYAGGQVSFAVFAAVLSIAVGELLWRAVRGAESRRRSLAQAQAALAVANERLVAANSSLAEQVAERTAELRGLASHLDHALEHERARTSRELHDELGQEITALRYTLDLVEARYDEAPDGIAPLLARLGGLVDRTATTTRSLVTALRPRLLETLSLDDALDVLLGRLRAAGTAVERTARLGVPLPAAVEEAVFRVTQEATTNVLRHARARRFSLALSVDGDGLTLVAEDDGVGLPLERRGGFGLVGMRERVLAAGGTLTLGAGAHGGTRITATLPLGGPPP